jgi:hypothetical protein
MKGLRNLFLGCTLLGFVVTWSCGGGAFYASIGPPPPPRVVGVVGVAPGPGYVWIDGFYDLRGSAWVWVPGTWRRPPYPRAVWEKPRWERHGNGYRFHRGRWRRGR